MYSGGGSGCGIDRWYIYGAAEATREFYFFTTVCFGYHPGQRASKTGKLYSNITHNSNTTHMSSNPQYSLRQAKAKQVGQLYRS
jgi:hypothetical protein